MTDMIHTTEAGIGMIRLDMKLTLVRIKIVELSAGGY
jgi:hypothetical protein